MRRKERNESAKLFDSVRENCRELDLLRRSKEVPLGRFQTKDNWLK